MNKKHLTWVLTGVLAAAVICVVIGLIIFYVSQGIAIPQDAPDFAELNAARAAKIFAGLVIICVGAASAVVPLIALTVLLIMRLLSKLDK